MLLDARLSVYLFKIGQKLHRKERVKALIKCPECGVNVSDFDQSQTDAHVTIRQKISNNSGKSKTIEYVVVGCEGYWVVDPETLDLPRGNWSPTYEIIRQRNK